MKLVSIQKDLTEIVTEANNYIEANQLAHNTTIAFKKISEGNALSNDLPSLFSMLSEMNLSVKSLYLYSAPLQEVIGSSLDELIIIPLKFFQDISTIIHELDPAAVESPSIFYYTGTPFWEVESSINEIETVKCESNTLYLFNSTAENPTYISSRYTNPYKSQDLGLFLNVYVNEDLSGYFSE